MSNGDDREEASVTTPAGGFTFKGKRTSEFIAVLLAIGVGVMGYVLWDHMKDTRDDRAAVRDDRKEMIGVLNKLSDSLDANAKEQRVTNCLIASPQNERNVEFCNRVVR